MSTQWLSGVSALALANWRTRIAWAWGRGDGAGTAGGARVAWGLGVYCCSISIVARIAAVVGACLLWHATRPAGPRHGSWTQNSGACMRRHLRVRRAPPQRARTAVDPACPAAEPLAAYGRSVVGRSGRRHSPPTRTNPAAPAQHLASEGTRTTTTSRFQYTGAEYVQRARLVAEDVLRCSWNASMVRIPLRLLPPSH